MSDYPGESDLAGDEPESGAGASEPALGESSDDPILSPEKVYVPEDEAPLPEAGDGQVDVSQPPERIGEGHAADIWWQEQSENGLCVPVSVAMIVSEFSGSAYSMHYEGELTAAAVELGLLEGPPWEGMSSDQAVSLLDHYGIPSHVEYGTIESLALYLEQDRAMMLAVDSDETWFAADDDTGAYDEGADHALLVTGIDVDRGVVVLQDPGQPHGQGYELPLETFMEAWDDSGNEMVVTDAAPSWQDGMADGEAEPAPAVPAEPAPVADTVPSDVQAEPPPTAAGTSMGATMDAGEGSLRDRGVRALGEWGRSGAVLLPIFLSARFVAGKLQRR